MLRRAFFLVPGQTTTMRGALVVFFLFWMDAADSATSTGTDDITPGLRNGLLYRPRGQLTLATGTWTAVIRFREKEVAEQAQIIREQFLRIDQSLEEVDTEMSTNRTVEGVRHLQFLAEMRKMWEHERAWMEAELRTGEAEVKELQIELSLSRRARGLINALGSGFKWLFGTATEEDTKRLHKDIKGLEIQTGKLHHLAELQATLIGTISKNQKRNTRNLAALAKKAMDLERSLAVTRAADHLTMTNIRRELDFINLMASAIRTASAAVMTFHHEIRKISRAMVHTQQGIVTPTLLPPAILAATMREITNHLPEGWVPAVPNSVTPATKYKFLSISAVALADGWEVHIQIPLQFRSYSQFQLYQVTSVPTHFPNSSIAMETKVPSKYFAISRDQRLHLEASQEEINKCRQTKGHTMCLGLTPLIKERREGCLYHAFRDDHEKAAQECSTVLVQPKPQLHQVTKNKWLYVFPQEETFSMQCTGEAQHMKAFRLQGTGVFSLPVGCAAMGDRYLVPAHLQRQAQKAEEVQLRDITRFKIKIDRKMYEAQSPGGKILNQTELIKIMEAAPKDDPGTPILAELQRKLEDWEEPVDSLELPAGLVSHTSLSLGALSLLGVIGLIIFRCVRGRRGTVERTVNQHASAPPAPYSAASAPLPDLEPLHFRLARLEAITGELQEKVERVVIQEVTLAKLQKKYDQLTALL